MDTIMKDLCVGVLFERGRGEVLQGFYREQISIVTKTLVTKTIYRETNSLTTGFSTNEKGIIHQE